MLVAGSAVNAKNRGRKVIFVEISEVIIHSEEEAPLGALKKGLEDEKKK